MHPALARLWPSARGTRAPRAPGARKRAGLAAVVACHRPSRPNPRPPRSPMRTARAPCAPSLPPGDCVPDSARRASLSSQKKRSALDTMQSPTTTSLYLGKPADIQMCAVAPGPKTESLGLGGRLGLTRSRPVCPDAVLSRPTAIRPTPPAPPAPPPRDAHPQPSSPAPSAARTPSAPPLPSTRQRRRRAGRLGGRARGGR